MKHLPTLLLTLLVSGGLWADTNTKYEGNGSYTTFGKDEKIKNQGRTSETQNEEGWFEGMHIDFNANGSIISQADYLYKDEYYKYFYTNGVVSREGRADSGIAQGEWTFYKTNGTVRLKTSFLDDKQHGLAKTYYENGEVKSEITYKNDLKNGLFKTYYENGKLRSEGMNRQDKKYGFSQEFYEDGLLKEEGNYVLDTKDGLWKRYNLEGEKSLEIIYNMGEVMKYPCRPEFCPYVQKYYTRSPTYPMRALRDEGEGCVMVEFTLSEKGIPLDARVLWSKSNSKRTKYLPDDIFDKPALESVRTYRYRPQHIDGIPTAVENVQSIIVFRIEGIDSMPQECKS